VDQTTERGATVTLGAGRALARIEPTKGAKWKFLAGPFSVRVTGTEFDLAWFPEQGVLELALHHGSVELSGPSFDEARTVRQGEFVRADLSDDEKVDARTKEESAQAKEESTGPEDDTSEDLPPEASSPEEKSSSSPTSTWRVQLASGDRKGALSSIEDAGSDQIFETATASELWAISDAARVGGHPSLARDALLALRAKHGSRGHSAYLLGKVYADQLHHPKKAIRWFETYLTEAPGDALSEQALGRLVELQVGTRRGVQAARRYLELYPNGSHANFARSSLR
jgi:hypothetical protein